MRTVAADSAARGGAIIAIVRGPTNRADSRRACACGNFHLRGRFSSRAPGKLREAFWPHKFRELDSVGVPKHSRRVSATPLRFTHRRIEDGNHMTTSTASSRTVDCVNPVISATRNVFEMMLGCSPKRKGLMLKGQGTP